jgi:hypothetical protein
MDVEKGTMSKIQMAMLGLLAAVMWVLVAALTPRYPATAPMPADGSAPPLPAPIDVVRR